eukprot:NODE_6178_length_873_cov_28.577333_g5946_i0.p1 GENE.NODE_6178_length_873_cov_28.577333_g5946_i0~~NODE_6178_length_873_cov_28.577333_g5946_i0.p1  ORF type:complete len:140 (-),score=28.80 NODE_6178_length_873_cov_28.577333_g5946_i0:121-540(-)
MPIHAEALMAEYVSSLFEGGDQSNVDYRNLLRHCDHADDHHIFIEVIYLTLVHCWTSDTMPIPKRMAALLAARMADWFVDVLPESVPAAHMVHFAAGILAAYGGAEMDAKFRELDRHSQRTFAAVVQQPPEAVEDVVNS